MPVVLREVERLDGDSLLVSLPQLFLEESIVALPRNPQSEPASIREALLRQTTRFAVPL